MLGPHLPAIETAAVAPLTARVQPGPGTRMDLSPKGKGLASRKDKVKSGGGGMALKGSGWWVTSLECSRKVRLVGQASGRQKERSVCLAVLLAQFPQGNTTAKDFFHLADQHLEGYSSLFPTVFLALGGGVNGCSFQVISVLLPLPTNLITKILRKESEILFYILEQHANHSQSSFVSYFLSPFLREILSLLLYPEVNTSSDMAAHSKVSKMALHFHTGSDV